MAKIAMQAARAAEKRTGTHRVTTSEGEAAIRLLDEKGYPSKRRQNGQSEHRCPFHEEPGDLKKGEAKFYVDFSTSKFYCHSASCGAKGNLTTLERHFGVDLTYADPAFKTRNQKLEEWEKALQDNPDQKKIFYDHGLDDATIERFRFGYDPEKDRFIIPYLDGKIPIAFRFYNPDPGTYYDQDGKLQNELKYYWERGAQATLYNLNDAGGDDKGRVFVCEGELKAAALVQMGYSAVATPGAGMFKDDWHGYFSDARQIIVLFDNDNPDHPKNKREIDKCMPCKSKGFDECEGHNAGQDAAAKVTEALGWRAINLVMPLPDDDTRKTDVNEYFVRDGHTASEFAEWALGEKSEPYKVQTLAEIMQDPPEQASMLIDGGILPSQGRLLIAGKPKVGKAQPLSALVLTPTGWTDMGGINPGDKVVGSNGRPIRVTHVHPQGVKPIYRVEFSDGSATEACADHLWQVQDHNDRALGRDGRVLDTLQVKALLEEGKTRSTYVPVVGPVEFESDAPLPIDPYVLGLLLGDGGFRQSTPTFTSEDQELFDALAERLPVSVERFAPMQARLTNGHSGGGPNPLTKALRDLGLWGHKSESKFIPWPYLRAGVDDRLALLQGLMDTDGGMTNNSAQFYTSSAWLRENVLDLVRGLGGTASVTEKGTDHLVAYRVTIRLPEALGCPFRLRRKAEAWSNGRSKRPPSHRIVSVTHSRDEEAQCITVDADDHLYVTEDYIVTHNSIFAENLVLSLAAGIPFLGQFDVVEPTRVLLLDRELSRSSLYERLMELMKYRPGYRAAAPNLCVDHDHLVKIDRKGAYDVLEKLVTYNGVKCVVFDTAYKFFSQSMDSMTAMTSAFEVLDKLIHETGVSVILTHHHKKSQNKNGKSEDNADPDNVAGSFLWTGWPNATILLNYLSNSVENPFNAVATFTAFRDAAPPDPLALYRSRDSVAYSAISQVSHEVVSSTMQEKTKPSTEVIMEWLMTNTPVPEHTAMEELCRMFGVRDTVVKPYFIDAMSSGFFTRRGKPPVIEYHDGEEESWEKDRQLHLIPGGGEDIVNKPLI